MIKEKGAQRIVSTNTKVEYWKDRYIGPAIEQTGAWETPLTHYLIGAVIAFDDYCRGDFSFLDMGAHIGYYSVLASYHMSGGRVYAFEPNPDNFKLLESNTHSFPNCHCFPYALDVEEGVSDFWSGDEETGGGSLIYDSIGDKDKVEQYKVETKKITSFDIDFSKVRIIKIDIQGKEPEIIKELSKVDLCPQAVIIAEKEEQTLNALKENGFTVYGFVGNGIVAYLRKKK